MVNMYIVKRYFEELEIRLPKKVIKDITIEIKPSKFRSKKVQFQYMSVDFSYKDKHIYSFEYDLKDVLEYGKNIHFESDTSNLITMLKDNIFNNYCNDLEE